MPLTLTRELRFGLHASASPATAAASNGFAGNPVLLDVAPFLTLAATVTGSIDTSTGMLINIKCVDRILRDHAVPYLREAHFSRRTHAATIVPELLPRLQPHFSPHTLTALRLSLSPYLAYSATLQEPDMSNLTLRFEFSAAHRLHAETLTSAENIDVFGRCNNPNGHGHNYELEVTVAGIPDPVTGQVMPILTLQEIVNTDLIAPYDHKHLNLDCPEFATLNPTVENIAATLYQRLKPHIPAPARLASLRVWETPKTMCEYSE